MPQRPRLNSRRFVTVSIAVASWAGQRAGEVCVRLDFCATIKLVAWERKAFFASAACCPMFN